MFKQTSIETDDHKHPPETPESHSRTWTLRVVALLMVAQAIGLAFISVVYISQVNWIRERALPGLTPTAVDTLLFSILSIPLALFAGRAVLGLMRRQKGAWLQAMVIQALLLVFALTTYILQEANNMTYWAMVSSIIVVMYLNTHEVRSSFYADTVESDNGISIFGITDDNETPDQRRNATPNEELVNAPNSIDDSTSRQSQSSQPTTSEDIPETSKKNTMNGNTS